MHDIEFQEYFEEVFEERHLIKFGFFCFMAQEINKISIYIISSFPWKEMSVRKFYFQPQGKMMILLGNLDGTGKRESKCTFSYIMSNFLPFQHVFHAQNVLVRIIFSVHNGMFLVSCMNISLVSTYHEFYLYEIWSEWDGIFLNCLFVQYVYLTCFCTA